MSRHIHKAFPAAGTSLPDAMSFVKTFAGNNGFTKERINEIELALEEALVNINNYAYPGGNGSIAIDCFSDGNGRMTLEISDSGIPFDMTAAKEPDITSTARDRKVGGLGILFIKKLINTVRYSRIHDRNVLRLEVYKEKP